MDISEKLNQMYLSAMELARDKDLPVANCSDKTKGYMDVILSDAESNKGVVTVTMTSVFYKKLHPEQDIRRHQASIEGGYSGRTFDAQNVTPFLKAHRFPAMSESGWLTRSLEQKVPYDEHYTGAIKPQKLKEAFIGVIDDIQNGPDDIDSIISYLLQGLIIQRDLKRIQLACPRNLPISGIVSLLDSHFHAHYIGYGASRLPVLAIYAIYRSLIDDGQQRYVGMQLLPLESHTSADARSGRIGDVDVARADGTTFEAVEVKFDIKVGYNIVETARQKILSSKVERYYILSTKEPQEQDMDIINSEITSLKNVHGCELIINGILPTIKYYLRLLRNPQRFVENYVELMETDAAIKFEHKDRWNKLISSL